MTTIEDAADELYAVAPVDFVKTRTALAARIKKDGDRDLAATVATLPKPSAGAWAVNLIARDDRADADRLVDLGERFRHAESGLDRAAVVELTRERKSLITELMARARELADDAGAPLNARAVDELEQTLRAGIADENAGTAVLTGRLVAGLRADGIDAVDLESAVAGSARPATRVRKATTKGDREAERGRAEAQRAAEHEAALARKAWKAADARRAKLADRVAEAERTRSALDDERNRIAAELQAVEGRRDDAHEEVERLSRELEDAEADERAAHTAAESAGGI